MEGNNNMEDYDGFWKSKSLGKNWREFILPNRTDEMFEAEGELQADTMNGIYFNEQSTVMEFGCGIGRAIKHINAKNRIGVDVCQAFLDRLPNGVKGIKTNGLDIRGVKNESIDFIYSLMVFQHINKVDHSVILKQLYSFLKPNGKMLVQFPSDNSGYYKQSKFVNVYSGEEINRLMASSGITSFVLTTGNLAGYSDGLSSSDTPHREYFVTIEK